MKFVFKLIPVYGLMGLWLALAACFDWVPVQNEAAFGVFLVGAIIALFGLISPIVSIFSHADELGKVVQCTQDVENAKAYLEEVKEHVKTVTEVAKEVDDSLIAKSDVDHPIVKAMRELTSAQNTLREEQDQLSRYKGNIAARKAGPFSWVVTMYGETV